VCLKSIILIILCGLLKPINVLGSTVFAACKDTPKEKLEAAERLETAECGLSFWKRDPTKPLQILGRQFSIENFFSELSVWTEKTEAGAFSGYKALNKCFYDAKEFSSDSCQSLTGELKKEWQRMRVNLAIANHTDGRETTTTGFNSNPQHIASALNKVLGSNAKLVPLSEPEKDTAKAILTKQIEVIEEEDPSAKPQTKEQCVGAKSVQHCDGARRRAIWKRQDRMNEVRNVYLWEYYSMLAAWPPLAQISNEGQFEDFAHLNHIVVAFEKNMKSTFSKIQQNLRNESNTRLTDPMEGPESASTAPPRTNKHTYVFPKTSGRFS
jgi:hypothetical protein